MKKIEIEIPEGKEAKWVDGVLTFIDEPKKHYEFEVGDKAILKNDTAFKQGDGVCLISAGAEVEIMSVSNCINDTGKLYEVKYQNATTVVKGGDIIPIEPKPVEYNFNVGDKASLNKDVCFIQVSGDYDLVNADTEVEIVKVLDNADASEKKYRIKHYYSTAVVLGRDLDKIEFKFDIGDRVTLVDCPLAVFTIADQIIKNGKPYYGVEGRPNCLPYEESELMPYDNKKVEYKFKVNDKVTFKGDTNIYTITDRFIAGKSCPAYKLDDCENVEEDKIELYVPQDITDRIKTFEDAVVWCVANGKKEMTDVYAFIHNNLSNMEGEIDEEDKDILAYLKLRIITCALNEGWEPTFEDDGYIGYYDKRCRAFRCCTYGETYLDSSIKLHFKSYDLAAYAANQFRDIYSDYCGYKGVEK